MQTRNPFIESEEVVVKRITRRLDRYLQEIESRRAVAAPADSTDSRVTAVTNEDTQTLVATTQTSKVASSTHAEGVSKPPPPPPPPPPLSSPPAVVKSTVEVCSDDEQTSVDEEPSTVRHEDAPLSASQIDSSGIMLFAGEAKTPDEPKVVAPPPPPSPSPSPPPPPPSTRAAHKKGAKKNPGGTPPGTSQIHASGIKPAGGPKVSETDESRFGGERQDRDTDRCRVTARHASPQVANEYALARTRFRVMQTVFILTIIVLGVFFSVLYFNPELLPTF